MKDGHCPQCDSNEIYATQTHDDFRAHDYTLKVYVDREGNKLGLNAYVCAQCGYVAMFVEDPGQLALLPKAKDWHRVGG